MPYVALIEKPEAQSTFSMSQKLAACPPSLPVYASRPMNDLQYALTGKTNSGAWELLVREIAEPK